MKEEPALKMYDNIYQEYCELVQKSEIEETNILKIKNDITKIEEKLTLDKSGKIKAIENIIYISTRTFN